MKAIFGVVKQISIMVLPVVTNADFTAAGLQLGCIDFRRATTPEMCGHDIEVPESILKLTDPMADDMAAAGDHAARMFTPGAAMSGFRIEGDKELGPLDEKYETSGATSSPTIVFGKLNWATGFLMLVVYASIAVPTW